MYTLARSVKSWAHMVPGSKRSRASVTVSPSRSNFAEMTGEVLEPSIATVITGLIGLLAGGALVLFMMRRHVQRTIRQPLEIIENTTAGIAQGAVSARIVLPEDADASVTQAALAINRLADRAAHDIEDMRRLERVRSEFIANVSHELRTPIFSVQGYLETLLDGAMDDPDVAIPFLEKAYLNAMRLNTLLNDLIDISRIESGELKFSFRYFDIVDLINELVHTSEIRARQANVTVHFSYDDARSVYGDKERLSQVLTNLIDNAIKYNVDGGRVNITTSACDDGVRIEIADTGIGIPEQHLSRIFERFYRVDKDRSRAVGGTGLGLAIVKHILEAHDAQIELTSQAGRGTRIVFTLRSGEQV
ncbi:MAG: two-component sensor histidine kinase [Candidatus Kapabacteria bacterium]|nr:two-component sensor histidine kinase [Candidatus Kapabacteria bacterium]